MNHTNGGYFCKNCTNYIPKDELSQHEQFCKTFNFTNKKNQNFTEFDYKDKTINGNKNNPSARSTDDYYNLSDAMITFGKNTALGQSVDDTEAFNPILTKNSITTNDNINVFKKAPSQKNIDKPLKIKDNNNINANNHSIKTTNNYINEETEKYIKEERYNIDE